MAPGVSLDSPQKPTNHHTVIHGEAHAPAKPPPPVAVFVQNNPSRNPQGVLRVVATTALDGAGFVRVTHVGVAPSENSLPDLD